jgi:predicted nucleic acid-binding protein
MKRLLLDSCVFIDAFDPKSANHAASKDLLDLLLDRNIVVTMPAHGWFEVQCSLRRLSDVDGNFVAPTFAGRMEYPIKLLHIDDHFIKKYQMAPVPHIKAGDHIFVAVAKIDGYTLVTSDAGMRGVAGKCNVTVLSPAELLEQLRNET